ncbi:hypothetical protein NDU88_008112 [Pleurodeles waltl]|uniref:Uncharacterized protein n=1 Tax=Pleurodeles waltl TaxID=8319 RepID=A0AAV7N407_PLEWA|nr:hypothetical protein NDU88_008112 [Pleurodeles waltl]
MRVLRQEILRFNHSQRAKSAQERREALEFQRQSHYYNLPRHWSCTRPVLTDQLLRRLQIAECHQLCNSVDERSSLRSYLDWRPNEDRRRGMFICMEEHPYRLPRRPQSSSAQVEDASEDTVNEMLGMIFVNLIRIPASINLNLVEDEAVYVEGVPEGFFGATSQ